MSAVTPPEGAPQTETPGNPAAPGGAPAEGTRSETPESPAAPPSGETAPEGASQPSSPLFGPDEAREGIEPSPGRESDQEGGLDTSPEGLRVSPNPESDPLVREHQGATGVVASPVSDPTPPADAPPQIGQNPPVNSHAPARYETVEGGSPHWPYENDGTIPEGREAEHVAKHAARVGSAPTEPLPREVYDAQRASLLASAPASEETPEPEAPEAPGPDSDLATGADEAKAAETAAAEMGGHGERTAS